MSQTSRTAKFTTVHIGVYPPPRHTYRVPVRLTPDPDGGFTATCPTLPGAVSEGDTKELALANITEALAGLLAAYRAVPPIPWRRDADTAGCVYVFPVTGG